jgi:anaerobic magnesium-protoporphyrin IX monomethyl ester cyclase
MGNNISSSLRCNFCYRMDPGFRLRSTSSIIEEIRMLQSNYGITYIEFVDELLMSSIVRTVEICESFIKENIKLKWNCNGRLNYAKKDVLRLMKEAGCVFINYGIESLDENALRAMNKALTVK